MQAKGIFKHFFLNSQYKLSDGLILHSLKFFILFL